MFQLYNNVDIKLFVNSLSYRENEWNSLSFGDKEILLFQTEKASYLQKTPSYLNNHAHTETFYTILNLFQILLHHLKKNVVKTFMAGFMCDICLQRNEDWRRKWTFLIWLAVSYRNHCHLWSILFKINKELKNVVHPNAAHHQILKASIFLFWWKRKFLVNRC